MNTPTNPPGIVWLISRCYPRPASEHLNAPIIFDWRTVGRIRAVDRKQAMKEAIRITGVGEELLKVVGIGRGTEKADND